MMTAHPLCQLGVVAIQAASGGRAVLEIPQFAHGDARSVLRQLGRRLLTGGFRCCVVSGHADAMEVVSMMAAHPLCQLGVVVSQAAQVRPLLIAIALADDDLVQGCPLLFLLDLLCCLKRNVRSDQQSICLDRRVLPRIRAGGIPDDLMACGCFQGQ